MHGGLKLPFTRIFVQRADIETMYFQAHNCSGDGHYVLGPAKRFGSRLERVYAIGAHHEILAELDWEQGDALARLGRYAKDVFNGIDPDKVDHLLWVIVEDWRNTRQGEFGLEPVGRRVACDLRAIVFRKPSDESWADLIGRATRIKKERDEAYLYPPKMTPEYPKIHASLAGGGGLHAFSSGGGLCVVSITRGRKSVGYGEHPHFEDALRILEDDVGAGCRPYESVYGPIEPHYLTGASQATSNVDVLLRKGNSFDCFSRDGLIVCVLEEYQHTHAPGDVFTWVMNHGRPKLWDARGFRFRSYPSGLPNGDRSVATECLSRDADGRIPSDAFMWSATKTGSGATIWEALQAMIVAPPIEVAPEASEMMA